MYFYGQPEWPHHHTSTSSCTIPQIKNGSVRARHRGNFLKFYCSAQYTLVGNKYATCRSGQWDMPIPVCVKPGCQELKEVKNAVNTTSHDNAWVVFFCLPGYQLVGSPALYCDGTQWNSTIPECHVSSAKKTETECDFEQPNICGWKPDEYHDFDWRRLNKKTPSSFLQTGPQYDHTYGKNGSGYYMYIESTGRIANETARLMSPVYEQDLAKDGCFVFWYHMFGRSMGGLVVYQKPAKLSMYQLQVLLLQKKAQNYTLFEQWGQQGNEWHKSIAMLSDLGDNFQIVIEGIRGQSFMSDIAIDDVSIQHGENCTKAMLQTTTPPSVLQSCVGRCDLYNEAADYRGCSCSIICIIHDTCCSDFLDVCDFNNSNAEDYSSSSNSEAPPQTETLITTITRTFAPPPSSNTTTKIPTIPFAPRPTTSNTTTTQMPATNTTTNKLPETTTTDNKLPEPTTTTTKLPEPNTTTTKLLETNKRSTTSTTNTASPPTTPYTFTTVLQPVFTRKIMTIEVSQTSSSIISIVRTTMDEAGVKTEEVCTCDCGGSVTG